MIPRASYSAPLTRYLRRRRFLLRFEALTAIAVTLFGAVVAVSVARSVILALLNLTFPGTPPGCC